MRSSPDPPYADIGIYGELARVARPALKDDGVLVAMCTPENLADVLAAMLGDLADTVLKYVGYQPAAVEELCGAIKQALSSGTVNGQGRCDVRFRAQAGELVITVAYPGRDEWRTTRPLP